MTLTTKQVQSDKPNYYKKKVEDKMVNGDYISIEEAEDYLQKEIDKREERLDYLVKMGASTTATNCEIDLLEDLKKRLRL